MSSISLRLRVSSVFAEEPSGGPSSAASTALRMASRVLREARAQGIEQRVVDGPRLPTRRASRAARVTRSSRLKPASRR